MGLCFYMIELNTWGKEEKKKKKNGGEEWHLLDEAMASLAGVGIGIIRLVRRVFRFADGCFFVVVVSFRLAHHSFSFESLDSGHCRRGR